MRKFPYKTWLWAGIFLLYPWFAYGAGLGKLTILSSLGQPLSAEIDLVSVQKDELSSLTARIAPPDAFQQANMQYSPALIGVRLSIERRSDGKPYIKIVSTRSINDPFLAILVELSWAQGRLVREYTALIDPPGYSPNAAPVATPTQVAPPIMATPTPESKSIASTDTTQAPAAAAQSRKPASKASAAPAPQAQAGEYAVKRGDTLARIAAGVKPEGVTLDQMLVGLYRNNTDAFAGNMNRLKTGTILRIPEKEKILETGAPDATKEVRVQSANWNAYRMKLAEAAGSAPPQEGSKSAASGKITTAVEDKAAPKEGPKEVLKLSKGDARAAGTGKGSKPISQKERMRMLEEEAVAREKALTEANERVVQLEKNIKDMQRLLELKGVTPPKPAVTQPPAKGDQVAKADAMKAEPAKAEPVKAEPAKGEAQKAEAAKAPELPKGEAKPEEVKGTAPVAETPKGEPAKAPEVAKAEAPKKAAPAKKAAPPPPPPEPSLVDQVIETVTDPMYLAGGLGGLAVLGGGAFFLARRRRAQAVDDEATHAPKVAPSLGAAAAPATRTTASPMLTPVANPDDVDPLAEADLYLNFGRDAQAEEVLKEALQKNPGHKDAQLKLLQIYAARKDKDAFEKVANSLHTQTSGTGETWIKAAAMGYAFDPDNSMYEAGKSAPALTAAAPAAAPAGAMDLDFDLELAPGASAAATPDVPLEGADKTMMLQPGELAGITNIAEDTTSTQDITQDSVVTQAIGPGIAVTPDFTIDTPAGGVTATQMPDFTVDEPPAQADNTAILDITGDSALASPMVSAIDFNFDAAAKAAMAGTPPADAGSPPKHDSTMVLTPENQQKAAPLGMDLDLGGVTAETPASITATGTGSVVQIDPTFKLDLGNETTLLPGGETGAAAPGVPDIKLDDISLSLEDAPKAEAPGAAPAPAGGGEGKDDHWYDVQTKFDLAKAYQEMGDKDGAREILQEVIKEGDAAQQAEAKQLLEALG